MTCIIEGAKTKKELREKLATNAANIYVYDPSVFGERHFSAVEMKVGQSEVVTNHPKRSWFAKITRTATGFKVS